MLQVWWGFGGGGASGVVGLRGWWDVFCFIRTTIPGNSKKMFVSGRIRGKFTLSNAAKETSTDFCKAVYSLSELIKDIARNRGDYGILSKCTFGHLVLKEKGYIARLYSTLIEHLECIEMGLKMIDPERLDDGIYSSPAYEAYDRVGMAKLEDEGYGLVDVFSDFMNGKVFDFLKWFNGAKVENEFGLFERKNIMIDAFGFSSNICWDQKLPADIVSEEMDLYKLTLQSLVCMIIDFDCDNLGKLMKSCQVFTVGRFIDKYIYIRNQLDEEHGKQVLHEKHLDTEDKDDYDWLPDDKKHTCMKVSVCEKEFVGGMIVSEGESDDETIGNTLDESFCKPLENTYGKLVDDFDDDISINKKKKKRKFGSII